MLFYPVRFYTFRQNPPAQLCPKHFWMFVQWPGGWGGETTGSNRATDFENEDATAFLSPTLLYPSNPHFDFAPPCANKLSESLFPFHFQTLQATFCLLNESIKISASNVILKTHKWVYITDQNGWAENAESDKLRKQNKQVHIHTPQLKIFLSCQTGWASRKKQEAILADRKFA